MKATTLSAALLAGLLAAPIALAQSAGQVQPDKQSTAPGASATTQAGNTDSARCEKLSGAEKAQCIKDENEKTYKAPPGGSASTSGSASSGGTTQVDPDTPPQRGTSRDSSPSSK